MDVEGVHDEVDGLRGGVLRYHPVHRPGKLSGSAVGSRDGEAPTGLRLDDAE